MFALTRAEIIERFRTPPVTQVDGLVQVYADCPADMRREYQLPVAGFVSGVCRRLYASHLMKPLKFQDPGIVVHIGDVRTNIRAVVVATDTRPDGTRFTRIRLPAPGHSDKRSLQIAAAKGFFLAVKGVELDDAGAVAALRESDPAMKAADERAAVARWRRHGRYARGKTDEDYLKLMRRVSMPGTATKEDVLLFASRLMLYPPYYGVPFCGKYDRCTFADAVAYAQRDPVVRIAAAQKALSLLVFGGGRGDRMTAAVEAYARFLDELAKGALSKRELRELLMDADSKLKGVLE